MPIRRVALCALATALLVPLAAALPVGAEEPAETGAPKVGRLPRPTPEKGQKAAYEPNAALVQFKKGTTSTARSRVLRAGNARTTSTVSTTSGLHVVKLRSDLSAPDLVNRLRKDPAVASASLNYRRQLTATPNDYYYRAGNQGALNTARLPSAWNLVRDASRQIVAVLDTGVDTGHPDLRGRLVTGYNSVTPGASVQDTVGHGTMVAGIVAANTNNSVGVAGTTWNGRVMPVKISNDGSAFDEDIMQGIFFATAHGAKVINMSFGGPGTSGTLQAAVRHAYDRGVVLVASAGNDFGPVTNYPAAYPEVLAVGATDNLGRLTDFSTFGEWVDVSAPGFGILSTTSRSASGGREYAFGDGTSFSSPLVAGVAALVRARLPSYTPAQVMSRLRATARDAGPRGVDPYHGWGLVDAYHAVGGTWGPEVPMLALGADEPNDTPSHATVLSGPSVSKTGTMANEGDTDWYLYTAPSDGDVRVQVTPAPFVGTHGQNIDPVLEIHKIGATFNTVRQDRGTAGQSETLRLDDVSAGRYWIKVSNYNGARDDRAYTLTVAPGGAATPIGSPIDREYLLDVSPVNFAGGVSVDSEVSVSFVDLVDSVTPTTLYLRNGRTGLRVPAAIRQGAEPWIYTIDPTAPLQDNTPYRIVINGVRNSEGALPSANFLSTFRTTNLAPAKVNGFAGRGAQPRAYLGWGAPNITDLSHYVVRAGTGNSWPTCGTCGYPIYSGAGTTVLTQPLANTATHNFRIWVVDRSGRWSPGADLRLAGTRFSTTYSTTQLTYGQTVTIGGRLNRTDNGALVTGVPVTLWGRQKGAPSWVALRTTNSSSAGTVSFTHRPNASTDYQLRYVGAPGVLGSVGGIIPVGVRPVMSIRASRTTLPLGQTVTLSGGVNPAHPGHTVYLQRLLPSGWTHVTTTRLNSASGYGFTLKPTARGNYAYRVVKPADADHLVVVSATQPFRVS